MDGRCEIPMGRAQQETEAMAVATKLPFAAHSGTELLHRLAGQPSREVCYPVDREYFAEACEYLNQFLASDSQQPALPIPQLLTSVRLSANYRLPYIAAYASHLRIRAKSRGGAKPEITSDEKATQRKYRHRKKPYHHKNNDSPSANVFRDMFFPPNIYGQSAPATLLENNDREEERHWRQEAIIMETVSQWVRADPKRQNRPICLVDVGAYGGEMAYLFHTSTDLKPDRVILIDPSKPPAGWLIDDHEDFVDSRTFHRFECGVGDVDALPFTEDKPLVIVVAKHLCGAGGDDLIRQSVKWDADLLVFAHCCQQNSTWESFAGQEQLRRFGIANEEDFRLFASKMNWKALDLLNRVSKKTNLRSQQHMYQIGSLFEQIFAVARQSYITSVGSWSQAASFVFCDERDTPKNIALVATREGALPQLVAKV